jgi:catechol 2,3-dioxygenase-like lactoylglutathione lyase family enzyme
MIKAKYKHTNIISRDWQKLAGFYEQVFGCVRIFPERHLSGEWLAKGTGIADAGLSGVHLRLPWNGGEGPTLEVFQYSQNEPKLPPVANREGFTHIAFEVDHIERAMDEVLKHGGTKVGDITSSEVDGAGILSFVYLADPEGNIIELQAWKESP